MAVKKQLARKVVLEQRFDPTGKEAASYVVARLHNYLDLDIGQRLTRKEVDRLINKGLDVTVQKGR